MPLVYRQRWGVGTNNRHQWQQKVVVCCALSLYRQVSTGWEALVAKTGVSLYLPLSPNFLGVGGLVAKAVAKHNGLIGGRQLSPRVQNKKNIEGGTGFWPARLLAGRGVAPAFGALALTKSAGMCRSVLKSALGGLLTGGRRVAVCASTPRVDSPQAGLDAVITFARKVTAHTGPLTGQLANQSIVPASTHALLRMISK